MTRRTIVRRASSRPLPRLPVDTWTLGRSGALGLVESCCATGDCDQGCDHGVAELPASGVDRACHLRRCAEAGLLRRVITGPPSPAGRLA
jgi:hypothetical protein